jgi:hypothetical protein
MSYAAPIADMRFALEACADFWSLRQRYPELDEDTLAAILEGAGALASETLAPLNRSGDRAGVGSAVQFDELGRHHKAAGGQRRRGRQAGGGQGNDHRECEGLRQARIRGTAPGKAKEWH